MLKGVSADVTQAIKIKKLHFKDSG